MPDKQGNGTLEAAAFAGAGRDRAAWICGLSKRRPAWLTSTGSTSQDGATKRSDSHLEQPATKCVSSQNSRGRNSVRSEGRLEAQDAAGRASPRLPQPEKKCPSKNLNSRRHKNQYRVNRQDRPNFFSMRTDPSQGIHGAHTFTGGRHGHARTHRKRTSGHSQRLSTLPAHSYTIDDE